jgi:hypothetical protein
MRAAFYYLAVGDDAAECLRWSYRSLREAGWSDDVLILTDKKRGGYAPEHHNTYELVLRPEQLNLDPSTDAPRAEIDIRNFDNANPYKFAISYLTPFIDDYVDITAYDYLMFIDIDILVAKALDDVIELLQENDRPFCVATNRKRIGQGAPIDANLSVEEIERHQGEQAISTGLVCFPGTDQSLIMLKRWKDECMLGLHGDQAALQAVLLRNYPQGFYLAPYSIHGYGPGWKRFQKEPSSLTFVDSVFIHFQGAIRNPEAMRLYHERYMSRDAVNL